MPAGLTCDVCSRPLELHWRPAVAEIERARVTLDRAPVLDCPEGHGARPADGAVAAAVTAAREQLGVARRPALPWRPQRCHGCSADLTMPGFRSERAVTVTAAGTPAYTLRLDVPLWRCTECAVENVPREAWADAEAAIAAALTRPEVVGDP